MLVPLVLIGLGIFVIAKKVNGTSTSQNARSTQSINGFSGATVPLNKGVIGAGKTGPASGTGNAGNANQPWYTGPAIAGASSAAGALGKGLVGLFSTSSSNTDSGAPDDGSDETPSPDEASLAQAQTDLGAYNESSTSNSDNPGDILESDDSAQEVV